MKKKILIIIAAVVLLLCIATFAIGFYLVNVAIGRDTDIPDIVPTDGIAGEDSQIIDQNTAKYEQHRKEVFSDPSLQHEVFESTSYDGLRLEADCFVPANQKPHRWAIVVHGYRISRDYDTTRDIQAAYLDRGFAVLAPDDRAHGASEGKMIGMGYLDRLDLLGWIQEILDRDPGAQIVVHGFSMGAAAVMMLSGEDLPINVYGLIEDAGYTSVWDEFVAELDYIYGLPPFPVLYMGDIISRFRAGYGWKEASSVDALARADRPMLFIHGEEDAFVPYAMFDQVTKAYAGPDLHTLSVPGAGHVQSYLRDPETYWSTVDAFLQTVLP